MYKSWKYSNNFYTRHRFIIKLLYFIDGKVQSDSSIELSECSDISKTNKVFLYDNESEFDYEFQEIIERKYKRHYDIINADLLSSKNEYVRNMESYTVTVLYI